MLGVLAFTGVTFIYFAYAVLPKVWFWVRARRMLRHLPRETEDTTTLIGCSERAVSGQRHLAYVGESLINICTGTGIILPSLEVCR